MFDARKLLDQLVGPQGGAIADQLLTQGRAYLGQGTDAASRGAAGMLGQDRVDRARDYVGRNAESLGVGAAAGGLIGLLLGTKTGRSLGGSALKLGALAAIGGLAYKAYADWQAKQGGAVGPGPDAGPAMLPGPEEQALARVLIVAMIQAAKADGVVDPTEYRTILGKAETVGIDPEASAFLDAELTGPADMDKVIAAATTPEVATQIYAASALAIVPDRPTEVAYLVELARRLGLDPALTAEIDARVVAARG